MVKKVCDDCERKLAEERLYKSWLCLFYEDVFCPYPKIPKDRRVNSVCLSCEKYAQFNREMDAEDERVMDEIDEIHRTGVYK